MSIENREFSKSVRTNSKRTYFFDIEKNKQDGRKFISINESKSTKDGFERNEIKLYIEDVNNFVQALNETINYYNSTIKPIETVSNFIEQKND